MRRAGSFLVVSCSLGLLLAGCSDEGRPGSGSMGQQYSSIPEANAEATLARELCNLMVQACDCSRQIFASFDQCVQASTQQLEADFEQARAAGLQYDPACMAEQVNLYTVQFGCSTLSELTGGNLTGLDLPTCKVFSGTAGEGERCNVYPTAFGDDCAAALLCVGATCQAVPDYTDRAEGEACDPQTDFCEPGTACLAPPEDPTASACTRLPGQGEACTVGCDVGLTCRSIDDGPLLCQPPPGVGEICGSFPTPCAAGAYCDGTTCAATLAEGTPCSEFGDEACGVGFVCDEVVDGGEDVCRPEEAYVCI